MSASMFALIDRVGIPARRGAAIAMATLFAVFAAFGGSALAAGEPAATRTEVPDGSPQLPAEKSVNNLSTNAAPRSASTVIVEEERVQGRLANARISVGGGRGYSIVDPNVGRVDRQADNGGKRVTPSLWELLRF